MKKPLLITLIIIIIIGAGTAVYYFMFTNEKSEDAGLNSNTDKSAINANSESLNTNLVDKSETWTIFNSSFDYSVSFPENWSAKTVHSLTGEEDTEGYEVIITSDLGSEVHIVYQSENEEVYLNKNNLLTSNSPNGGRQDITINNKVESLILAKEKETTNITTLVFFKYNDVQYMAELLSYVQEDDLAKQIASSINFSPDGSEQKEVSTWQTIEYKEFSIEVPKEWVLSGEKRSNDSYYVVLNQYANEYKSVTGKVGHIKCPIENDYYDRLIERLKKTIKTSDREYGIFWGYLEPSTEKLYERIYIFRNTFETRKGIDGKDEKYSCLVYLFEEIEPEIINTIYNSISINQIDS